MLECSKNPHYSHLERPLEGGSPGEMMEEDLQQLEVWDLLTGQGCSRCCTAALLRQLQTAGLKPSLDVLGFVGCKNRRNQKQKQMKKKVGFF